jgi:alkanesulfonate monooxygenase SsuD/methylene tetrahydromethanopterin reductase-like flavin-dependent oxidoreductase (luciferase family)
VEYGAHLPLLDLDGRGWDVSRLTSYARTAERLGFRTLAANDHLTFRLPWLDGIVALSSVVEASGGMTLATTAALPVVRGPEALASSAAALHALSGGRLALGLGPGSSRADYALAGIDFEERWPRFEAAVRTVRARLGDEGPPVWIASWGSAAGLRRVARLGDGWLASAYNTTPEALARGRRTVGDVPCTVATLWTCVTDDAAEGRRWLARLAAALDRPGAELAGRVLVGSPERCADLLGRYAAAGADRVLAWPVTDHERQLERLMRDVVPRVRTATGS